VEIPLLLIQMFGVYLLGSTVGFIWWMATITEKVNNLVSLVQVINTAGYAKKQDVDRELGRIQGAIDEAHSRIDAIQLKHS
jgi:hypothetical protein